MSVLGKRIKLRRRELGISQEELANTVGANRGQISRYETGHNDATSDVIIRLAEALKVTPNWLLGVGDGAFVADLGEDERELLKLYHSKNPQTQQKILEFVKIM